MRKHLLVLFLCLSSAQLLFAQNRTVTGIVTGADDGLALPGVNVLVKGTTIGTVTDASGSYSIEIPSGSSTLVFSFIGYANQEIAVGERTTVNVSMQSDATQLSEVVVVAYGTADKRSFTGSVGEVDASQIKNRSLTNVANAVVGTVSGVQAISATGQPGATPAFQIRGVSSINGSNDPLYVVDGVPYPQNINNLNMDDVESISVLKDAASTTLYGARAARGVVIITTKKGKVGKPRLDFKAEQGWSTRAIPEYDRVNASEYYTLMWESYRNSLSISGTTPEDVANQMATDNISNLLAYNPFNVPGNQLVSTDGVFNPNAELLYTDLDWFEPLERSGTRNNYSLNVSGGTEDTKYLVSMGYVNEKGYIINSDFERYTGRLDLSTKPIKWINMGLNISGTYTEANNARTTGSTSFVNPFFFARNMGAIYPVYEHDPVTGEFILDDAGNRVFDLGFGPPARPSGASPGRHTVQEALLNVDAYKRTVMSGRGFVEAQFLKNFTFRTNVGVDLYSIYEYAYDNKIVGDGAPSGRASRTHSTETNLLVTEMLTYQRTFADKHNLNVLLGHENQSFVDNSFSGSRQGQVVDGNTELINFTDINSVTSSTGDEAFESYFGRIEYDYNGKYFLNLSIRRDGSSRFAPESRWGNFPAIGASWRMENEAFIGNINWINALKLRASYGATGNYDFGGYYPYQGLYELGFNNVNEPGYLQSNPANPELHWEKNLQLDFGTDFVLFSGRLQGTIEYFNRKSRDLLFSQPLPLSVGSPEGTINRNIAELTNRGFEVVLSGDVLRAGDFTWNLSVNATSFKSEITSLPVDEFVTGTKKWSEGHSIYDYWLRDYYGVNTEDGSPLYRLNTTDNTFSDVTDVVIGSDTLTSIQSRGAFHYAGSALPDLYGGITNTFSFRNFSLTVLTTYQIGGYTYDNGYQALLGGADYGDAIHKDALNRWQKPGDVTNVPRVDVANNTNSGATSDRWLTSSTHLNLRQVTLNYDLPKSLLNRIGMANASVYVSGENLKIFNKRDGMNVTQNFSGVTSNGYIPSRIVSIGLQIGL